MNINPYTVLEVNENADISEIKSAYRKLSMKYHPDKNPEDKVAEEKFKEISFAWSILSDEEKRRKYDEIGNTNFIGLDDEAKKVFKSIIETIFNDGYINSYFSIPKYGFDNGYYNTKKKSIKKDIINNLDDRDEKQKEFLDANKKLVKNLKKLSPLITYVGNKQNLIKSFIEHKINVSENNIKQIEKNLEIGKIVREEIDNYLIESWQKEEKEEEKLSTSEAFNKMIGTHNF